MRWWPCPPTPVVASGAKRALGTVFNAAVYSVIYRVPY